MKSRALILVAMCMAGAVGAHASTVSDRMAAVRQGERIAPAWEAEAISATHGAVGRKGLRLTLRLSTGKALFFVDTVDACDSTPVGDCKVYKFLAFLPKSHVFVVQKSYYEGCPDYLLVDAHSGRRVLVGDVPVFSADEHDLLIQNECLADDHTYHFEIWKHLAAGWRREWGYTDRQAYDADPELKEPYNTYVVSWQGNTIVLHFETKPQAGNSERRRWVGRLVRHPDGWHLTTHTDP